jgi:hypothetical protein
LNHSRLNRPAILDRRGGRIGIETDRPMSIAGKWLMRLHLHQRHPQRAV